MSSHKSIPAGLEEAGPRRRLRLWRGAGLSGGKARCPACGKGVRPDSHAVHYRDELFHAECALYHRG